MLLDKLDQGIKDKTIAKLPLVGNLDKADTFVTTLRDEFLAPLEMVLMTNNGCFDVMEDLIERNLPEARPQQPKAIRRRCLWGTGILGDRTATVP